MTAKCKLYPRFTTRDAYGNEAEFWKEGNKFFQETLAGAGLLLNLGEEREISFVAYAIALAFAHEAAEKAN